MTEDIDIFEKKREEALKFLGEKWVLHPEYEPDPRHNLSGYSTGKYKTMQQ